MRPVALEPDGAETLLATMLQRGSRVSEINPSAGLLVPESDPDRTVDAFYRLLRKYSFRLFLRDVCKHSSSLDPRRLSRFVTPRIAAQYLRKLTDWGLVHDGKLRSSRISSPTPSFGRTLEWFLAHLLERAFRIPAVYGVRLSEDDPGGDFDVLGQMHRGLLYLEVKSSPPKHIHQAEVDQFFERLNRLQPEMALFLVDTNLRMLDKLVPMFETALTRLGLGVLDAGHRPPSMDRVRSETFRIGRSLYLTNSKPDLEANIRLCLKNHHGRPDYLARLIGT